MRHIFRFYKSPSNRWYIDLPGWNGHIADLEMVEGADTMLNMVSGNTEECFVDMSDEPFEGSDIITLVTDLRDSIGGGNYVMETYKGAPVDHPMWLCAVTEYVFSDLPKAIYVNPLTNNSYKKGAE